MPSPVYFEVKGLYGEFDHSVAFPRSDEFAIIYGPNGVGKTRFFEIIEALSTLRILDLTALPFTSASIRYDDESALSIMLQVDPDHWTITLESADSLVPATWEIDSDTGLNNVRQGRLFLGGSTWRYEGQDIWMDEEDGERVSSAELQGRYGVEVFSDEQIPQEFAAFRNTIQTYLIETQRLRNRSMERGRLRNARATAATRAALARMNARTRGDQDSTVSRYAADLQGRLATALADNSRTTQTLDRTFPRRLLDETESGRDEAESSIRARYATQNQKRERLAELSLISSEPDLPLQDQALLDWQRRVLKTYLDDTEAKLNTFDELLSKVNLLEEIINKRFIRKRIRVNADEGLSIEAERSGAQIFPQDLSSGEQHELIMFYDLLFRVSPGALVMIDEPEISLHVAWQRDFLDDISRVAHVSDARMLVATHSPQIIGKWRQRTTQLRFDAADSDDPELTRE